MLNKINIYETVRNKERVERETYIYFFIYIQSLYTFFSSPVNAQNLKKTLSLLSAREEIGRNK